MILLCGIPTETPIAMVREELDGLGVPYAVFNQRHFSATELEFAISGNRVTGRITIDTQDYRLEDICGVYTRLMDDQVLPELKDEPAGSPRRRYCRALHDALMRWCEIMPGRVVNRTGPMGSNSSKPYQAQLIREQGFAIPETLVTNDPDLVLQFRAKHKRIIYKSISGVRSIVQTLEDEDRERLAQIRWCPTQFQEFVEGTNVRVHTVGTEVFATAITTEAADYRYAHRAGKEVELKAFDLPGELANKCVRLARALELPFAGIDLKITPDNRVYCFEVNPSPAFSYYESNTGQPIARAVARYLAGETQY
ncbi:MAG: ATP-grasp domain-containing protein [Gammaproteobacteria bacterium]|nr:ATP-grasp domain-containing protein [Gammaproteobacteria bacterium]